MSEDRTAAAALAIERYITGLREELALLGAVESRDLAWEIRDMLTDAAREDAEQAFAEMERLGAPSVLAATLLAERGITPEGGMPAASWWRLGIAATIDTLIGFAAPALILVTFVPPLWTQIATALAASGGGQPVSGGEIVVVGAVLVMSAVLAWRAWEPWRTGGRSATAGMALADVAVVRIGGSRTVVRRSELAAAGLDTPRVGGLVMTATVASVVLAALILGAAASSVANGALDQSGAQLVQRLAGPETRQRDQVVAAVKDLYAAAETTPTENAIWPQIESERLDPNTIKASLVKTFATARESGDGGYQMNAPVSTAPGIWQVSVTELPGTPEERQVILEYGLRVDWSENGGTSASDHSPAWVLIAYDWTP